MTFIPKDQVQWREVKYLKINTEGPAEQHPYEFKLKLPEPLASWDVMDYWEAERTHSMHDHLTKDDILFDVGAEHGWLSLVYAQFVGPRNIILIEPTPEFWSNIKSTWYRNFKLVKPRAFYDGLFSDKTTDPRTDFSKWPENSKGDLIDRNSYRYIHEHGSYTPQMTLDDFVERSGIVPTALTIDCEGAELTVLRGAQKTLCEHPLKVWVSIHPEMMVSNYGVTAHDLHIFMDELGYKGEWLGTSHEEMWLFEVKQ